MAGILPKDPKSLNELASKLGATYYVDPETGYKVLTSFFLEKRGYCCNNSCRHCPYNDSTLTTEQEEAIKKL